MGHNFRSFRIVLLLLICLVTTQSIGQEFTIAQLIGKSKVGRADQPVPLNSEVANAFELMCEAALKDSIQISAVSGYRNFERQKKIWERKFNAHIDNGLTPEVAIDRIIKYSAIPGTSRHHWGTEVDIIDMAVDKPEKLLLPENYEVGGCFFKLKKWMDEHANTFGFYLVYTEGNRSGFSYEPWHYSYKAVSQPMLQAYLLLYLPRIIEKYSFEGSVHLTNEVMSKYLKEHILDINPVLR